MNGIEYLYRCVPRTYAVPVSGAEDLICSMHAVLREAAREVRAGMILVPIVGSSYSCVHVEQIDSIDAAMRVHGGAVDDIVKVLHDHHMLLYCAAKPELSVEVATFAAVTLDSSFVKVEFTQQQGLIMNPALIESVVIRYCRRN